MPLFEYTCADCGKTAEILVKSASDTPVCPHCGGRRLSKEFSTFAAKGLKADHVHTGPCCPCGKNSGGCGSH